MLFLSILNTKHCFPSIVNSSAGRSFAILKSLITNAFCEGFATSFQIVMSKLGVYSVRIEGNALNSKNEIQSHSWNVVQKDKQWYLVDSSYDILHNLNDVQLFFLRIYSKKTSMRMNLK